MRRHGNLFALVCDRDNLSAAFDRAARGKRWQRTVKVAIARKEEILDEIETALREGSFRTSAYRTKQVYEPKERTIYVLPFIPDRVVQHALMAVLAPIWDAMFDSGAYACRPGRGQHLASTACMNAVRKFPWVMQADVRKFYPSVPHDRLMNVVRRKVKDARVLALLENIVYSFPGGRNLPIGNLSSQWLGALYMNELDVFVRNTYGPGAYLRYCDDFLVFGGDKDWCHEVMEGCRGFLADSLGLTMAKEKVYRTAQGVDFVGYRHFAGYKLIRKASAKRMRRRVAEVRWKLRKGRMEPEAARSVAASIRGWLGWANAWNLSNSMGLNLLEEDVHAALV
jgi:RNA-directed DNA polymerase